MVEFYCQENRFAQNYRHFIPYLLFWVLSCHFRAVIFCSAWRSAVIWTWGTASRLWSKAVRKSEFWTRWAVFACTFGMVLPCTCLMHCTEGGPFVNPLIILKIICASAKSQHTYIQVDKTFKPEQSKITLLYLKPNSVININTNLILSSLYEVFHSCTSILHLKQWQN